MSEITRQFEFVPQPVGQMPWAQCENFICQVITDFTARLQRIGSLLCV